VLSDLRLTQGDGFGVLRASKEHDPQLPVIVMTAFGSIQDAVAAMKEGALDFLAKPVDPDHLLLMVERALTQRRLATENMILKDELAQRRGAPLIVGDDPKLKQVSLALHRAAATDTTVLLEGESGTGKELFARALHALSPRNDGPFVAINCAAIPETLLETELFGHEKGAFTGADRSKVGLLEAGNGGTIFLDEIGEMPLSLQPRLLRAIEARQVLPVGAVKPRPIDVRFIAATNRDLEAEVAKGTFRRDLFFRLNTLTLAIPPLRERTDEIGALVDTFLEDACREAGRPAPALTAEAMHYIRNYDWPGNIRELKNVIERALVLCDGDEIHSQLLPLDKMGGGAAMTRSEDSGAGEARQTPDQIAAMLAALPPLDDPVKAAERQAIVDALAKHAGNQTRAAGALGMPRRTFITKLDAYGIPRPQKRPGPGRP
jgi:DNA-binding NtrC family response regulator